MFEDSFDDLNCNLYFNDIQGPKKWFAKCDKHYPSRYGQTSLATAVTNLTKPVTKINFELSTMMRISLQTCLE